MKRLQTVLFIVILLCSAPAMAQYGIGSLGMYTSGTTMDDCDVDPFTVGSTYDVWFWCMIDPGGPDGIKGFQFRVAVEEDSTQVIFGDPQWNMEVIGTGTIGSGIAMTVTGGQCYGVGETAFSLGYVPVLLIGPGPFHLHVVPDPRALPEKDPLIMSCEEGYPQYKMRGGWYSFGAPCDTDAEDSSWGAIKSIYGR